MFQPTFDSMFHGYHLGTYRLDRHVSSISVTSDIDDIEGVVFKNPVPVPLPANGPPVSADDLLDGWANESWIALTNVGQVTGSRVHPETGDGVNDQYALGYLNGFLALECQNLDQPEQPIVQQRDKDPWFEDIGVIFFPLHAQGNAPAAAAFIPMADAVMVAVTAQALACAAAHEAFELAGLCPHDSDRNVTVETRFADGFSLANVT